MGQNWDCVDPLRRKGGWETVYWLSGLPRRGLKGEGCCLTAVVTSAACHICLARFPKGNMSTCASWPLLVGWGPVTSSGHWIAGTLQTRAFYKYRCEFHPTPEFLSSLLPDLGTGNVWDGDWSISNMSWVSKTWIAPLVTHKGHVAWARNVSLCLTPRRFCGCYNSITCPILTDSMSQLELSAIRNMSERQKEYQAGPRSRDLWINTDLCGTISWSQLCLLQVQLSGL